MGRGGGGAEGLQGGGREKGWKRGESLKGVEGGGAVESGGLEREMKMEGGWLKNVA